MSKREMSAVSRYREQQRTETAELKRQKREERRRAKREDQ